MLHYLGYCKLKLCPPKPALSAASVPRRTIGSMTWIYASKLQARYYRPHANIYTPKTPSKLTKGNYRMQIL